MNNFEKCEKKECENSIDFPLNAIIGMPKSLDEWKDLRKNFPKIYEAAQQKAKKICTNNIL